MPSDHNSSLMKKASVGGSLARGGGLRYYIPQAQVFEGLFHHLFILFQRDYLLKIKASSAQHWIVFPIALRWSIMTINATGFLEKVAYMDS